MLTIQDITIFPWGYELRYQGSIVVAMNCGKNSYKLIIEKSLRGKKYTTLAKISMEAMEALGHIPILEPTQRNLELLCEYPYLIKKLK